MPIEIEPADASSVEYEVIDMNTPLPVTLQSLRFKNSDFVRRDMRFEYHNRPCFYAEDIDSWTTPWDYAHYSYLFEICDLGKQSPPSGMRSAVPLGGLGAGTVELRADGSLRDWTIFNNSPAGGGPKVQLEEAFFAARIKVSGEQEIAQVLRTHPPRFLPGVERIDYSGAYPVSRLIYTDPSHPVELTLFACSEFHLRNAEKSATPAVLFTFLLKNGSDRGADASLLFTLPNHIRGELAAGENLVMRRPGSDPVSGSMAIAVTGDIQSASTMAADSVFRVWEQFTAWEDLTFGRETGKKEHPIEKAAWDETSGMEFGAIAAGTKLNPGEMRTVSFVLGWFFPFRPHGEEVPGNYYVNMYRDAEDVAEKVLKRKKQTWDSILAWQKLCFDNSLPGWLQDAMVNSLGTMAKTGMWVRDGRWRQWESFSCPNSDPIHIQFYRVLPYAWFFSTLKRNQIRCFASAQTEDGYMQEKMGGKYTRLDQPFGRNMGDGCTAFILELYQDYLWMGDREFTAEFWPVAKKAAEWQIRRAAEYGIPDHLNNSYDWFFFAEKDLVSYNAFLHLAALKAAERLARVFGDEDFARTCEDSFVTAQKAVEKYFWTGQYFRSWWIADGEISDALHADTLYGQLWAEVLDLGPLADRKKLRSHLSHEKIGNSGPFGLKVMQGTDRDDDRHPEVCAGFTINTGGPVNNIVWEAGSLDWCSLSIYLGGDIKESLGEAEKIYAKWRSMLKDQWDIRDLTTGWDGYPWCNSHYARQLILWTIPLALSGQRYSAPGRALSFEPRVAEPAALPFFTPTAHGILELVEGRSPRLRILAGTLEVEAPVVVRSTGVEIEIIATDQKG